MELGDILFAFLNYLIEALVIIAVNFFVLQNCRMRNKRLAFGVYLIVMMIGVMSSKMLFPNAEIIFWRACVMYTFYMTLPFVFFKDSFPRTLSFAIWNTILVSLSEVIAVLLLEMVSFYPAEEILQFKGGFRIGTVLVSLVMFVVLAYFAVTWKMVVDKQKVNGWLLFLVFPTYQLVLLLFYFKACQEYTVQMAWVGMGMVTLGLILDSIMLYFINSMVKKLEVEEKLSELYKQRQYELEYYKMADQHIEDMRAIRHDYLNHIQTAYIMMENGESEDSLRKLLGDTEQWLISTRTVRYCENAVANALLSVKVAKAMGKGIKMECECNIPEYSISREIEEIDICSLLGNLLDNAIEACSKVENQDARTITVKADIRGGYQYFVVKNGYLIEPQYESGKLKTIKKDAKEHGYGLRMVEKVCEKYDGRLEIQAEDNIFESTVWLKLRETAE